MSNVVPIRTAQRRSRFGRPGFMVVCAFVCGALLAWLLPAVRFADLKTGFLPRELMARIAPHKGPNPGGQAWSVQMPVCGVSRRVTCVVDGDTIWLNREKIRLASFNTPEIGGACLRERQLAQQARRRLSEVLSSEQFFVQREGRDRYGRTLARVSTAQGDVGLILIAEGLAHRWRGYRQSWC